MKKIILFLILLLFLTGGLLFAQSVSEAVYKTIDTTILKMEIYYPPDFDTSNSYPAIVFFFGGGWSRGSTAQFEPHAKYFSQRGMVCFLVNYRVRNIHPVTPFESLKDAKSAIRYIRKHASEWHIDPSRIVASGGSAGGHLAAATALIDDYNENTDDLSVSCIPDALVLYNPVIDNGPGGYGYDRVGEEYRSFSPLHNIRSGAPPTIFFLGTEDKLIPVETARYYKKVMEIVGSRCDLKISEGEAHGFFNYSMPDNYRKTVLETDEFLQSLGYLGKEPKINIE
jgi:acetyl esterase